MLLSSSAVTAQAADPWLNDLQPLPKHEWNYERAQHLLERAGFGATPQDIEQLARLTPAQAVRSLVRFQATADKFEPFDDSGSHDAGLEPFAASRPAATDLAKATGQALGVKVKPSGNRQVQQVADRYLYWLRASRLETHRLSYWWANRMLTSPRPFQEKMTLFWHGHFATSEEKVRDYRKGAPNENFAREIMELFTMGVGNYSEQDIREAARAFTGWNYTDLKFVINPEQHDDGLKTVLQKTGNFNGEQVIDILLAQPVTAEFLAGKLYRYFVREDLSPLYQQQLGKLLRESDYDMAVFMETVLLSKDFYSKASVATRIKPPVELLISTYKKMGLKTVPGLPDFNQQSEMLGQKLFYPPNVAGWAQGRSWITPGYCWRGVM